MTAIADLIGEPIVRRVEVVVDHSVRGLCTRRYPGHPKGCPNFGKKSCCPPRAPMIERVIDLAKPVWLLAIPFDLGTHVRRMGERHPEWTERQKANLLYWQAAVRKKLFESATYIPRGLIDTVVVRIPEACGVDMTATCANAGITLEWPPRKTVWKAGLLGTPVAA
jgi:predicted metal-binding protein